MNTLDKKNARAHTKNLYSLSGKDQVVYEQFAERRISQYATQMLKGDGINK